MLCGYCILCLLLFMFFFFKQKTAYEMRISDWSSDVCSSDLGERCRLCGRPHGQLHPELRLDLRVSRSQARRRRAVPGGVRGLLRVEPSLQAAFIEYGGNRHGFLAFSEIHPDYYPLPKEARDDRTSVV